MEKKEEKKGFWASLFTPKTCSCSCESNIIEELEGDKEKQPEKPAEKRVKTKARMGTTVPAADNDVLFFWKQSS